jgi:hypothetical protein
MLIGLLGAVRPTASLSLRYGNFTEIIHDDQTHPDLANFSTLLRIYRYTAPFVAALLIAVIFCAFLYFCIRLCCCCCYVRKPTQNTALILEIGNAVQRLHLPLLALVHEINHYCLRPGQEVRNVTTAKTCLAKAELTWSRPEHTLIHRPTGVVLLLPTSIALSCAQLSQLRRLLASDCYVLLAFKAGASLTYLTRPTSRLR